MDNNKKIQIFLRSALNPQRLPPRCITIRIFLYRQPSISLKEVTSYLRKKEDTIEIFDRSGEQSFCCVDQYVEIICLVAIGSV